MQGGVVHQGHLLKHLKTLFPREIIKDDARSTTTLKYPDTNEFLELDAFIPEYNLCFEFQDAYHYISTWYTQFTLHRIQKRDEMAQKHGLTMITVPCWWNGEIESLVSCILFSRPDFIFDFPIHDPIALNPPNHFFSSVIYSVPHVGELMVAAFPTDSNFKNSISPSSPWWLGEKYDGVRCCWNPITKILYTRTGRVIQLLDCLEKEFPKTLFLDGEIWFGRGQFAQTHLIAKSNINSVHWHQMKAISFDTPDPNYKNEIFKDRYSFLLNNLPINHSFHIVAMRTLCKSKKMCDHFMHSIIEDDGEGIILRKPNSIYEHGRSPNLVKLKVFNDEKEALVVSVEEDAVTLQMPNQTLFSVAVQDILVPEVMVGDIVSFSHEWQSRSELPKSPVVHKIRSDLLWEEVVHNSHKSKETGGFTVKPPSYWNFKNMRSLFESVARKFNLDPLLPHTWYSLTRKEAETVKGAESIFGKFGGYIPTITSLFNDLEFDKSKFQLQPGHWRDNRNTKTVFDKFASDNEFDPLIADNWYNVTQKQLVDSLGTRYNSVLQYYKGYKDALVKVYPNIGLEIGKIGKSVPVGYYEDKNNLQDILSNYAKENGFDPLIASNWYTRTSIKNTKILRALKLKYPNVREALMDLFPDIGLNKSLFIKETGELYKYHWNDFENHKNFFSLFAQESNFNPMDPNDWYSADINGLKTKKGYNEISSLYGGIDVALTKVFEHLTWDNEKLAKKFAKQKHK